MLVWHLSEGATAMSDPETKAYWPGTTEAAVLNTSIGRLLRDAAASVPDRLALVEGIDPALARRWTYRELLADAERVATALLSDFEPGARIAVYSPNRWEWALLQLGAALAGMVLVTVNPALRKRELRYVLQQSRSCALFYSGEYRGQPSAEIVAELRPQLPELRLAFAFEEWDDFLRRPAAEGIEFPVVQPRDAAQIQYTSGTTGSPKGCLLHHQGTINAARIAGRMAGLQDGDVWINPMPMFHVGSCVMAAVGILALHGTHVLLPGFEPGLVLEMIQEHRGNMMLVVPTILHSLVNHPDVEKYELTSMRGMLCGGSTAPAALVQRAEQLFGANIAIGYGQTEAHGVVCQSKLTDSQADRMTTVGHALPHMELAILDPATGEMTGYDEQGEICVRGYQSMLGYFELPEATAAALDQNGWLHTGDLGAMDDRGFVRVTGRLKDMIIRGGENIYPREIEELLLEAAAVYTVEVVGVPDEHWGEQVGAIVQLRPGDRDVAEVFAELREYCLANLARFKVPRLWFAVDEFPITASGKIQKFALRTMIATGEMTPVLKAD
jgi:fatty-acyl-CoA synthase